MLNIIKTACPHHHGRQGVTIQHVELLQCFEFCGVERCPGALTDPELDKNQLVSGDWVDIKITSLIDKLSAESAGVQLRQRLSPSLVNQ